MIMRICPQCKNKVYSADTVNDWVCPYCSAKIPV